MHSYIPAQRQYTFSHSTPTLSHLVFKAETKLLMVFNNLQTRVKCAKKLLILEHKNKFFLHPGKKA